MADFGFAGLEEELVTNGDGFLGDLNARRLVGAAVFVLETVGGLGLIGALVDAVDDAVAVAIVVGAAVFGFVAELVLTQRLALVLGIDDAVLIAVGRRAAVLRLGAEAVFGDGRAFVDGVRDFVLVPIVARTAVAGVRRIVVFLRRRTLVVRTEDQIVVRIVGACLGQWTHQGRHLLVIREGDAQVDDVVPGGIVAELDAALVAVDGLLDARELAEVDGGPRCVQKFLRLGQHHVADADARIPGVRRALGSALRRRHVVAERIAIETELEIRSLLFGAEQPQKTGADLPARTARLRIGALEVLDFGGVQGGAESPQEKHANLAVQTEPRQVRAVERVLVAARDVAKRRDDLCAAAQDGAAVTLKPLGQLVWIGDELFDFFAGCGEHDVLGGVEVGRYL